MCFAFDVYSYWILVFMKASNNRLDPLSDRLSLFMKNLCAFSVETIQLTGLIRIYSDFYEFEQRIILKIFCGSFWAHTRTHTKTFVRHSWRYVYQGRFWRANIFGLLNFADSLRILNFHCVYAIEKSRPWYVCHGKSDKQAKHHSFIRSQFLIASISFHWSHKSIDWVLLLTDASTCAAAQMHSVPSLNNHHWVSSPNLRAQSNIFSIDWSLSWEKISRNWSINSKKFFLIWF